MSGNPNVQLNFNGVVPDVRLQPNAEGRNVNIDTARNTRNVMVTVSRGGGGGGGGYNVYYNTTAYWNSKPSYVPDRGDVLIYSDHGQIDDGYGTMIDVPGIKIGDGSAYLIDLPFVGADVRYEILTELRQHSGNTLIHVTPEEKEFWNNKLNCTVDSGKLILNRL